MSTASNLLDRIKLLAIQAMFLDDELLEQLVLKGGNAMALVHRVSARASVDLDFSMQHDFGEAIDGMKERIERTLTSTFREAGFDQARPRRKPVGARLHRYSCPRYRTGHRHSGRT